MLKRCPDRPVGRLLESRAPAPPETDPYCDFCGRLCRGDCQEKRQAVAGFARALADVTDFDGWWSDPVVPLADGED